MNNNEKLILGFIIDYWTEHGKTPRVKDIQEFMCYSELSTASTAVRRLIEKGLIKKEMGPKNTYKLIVVE